MDIKVVLEQLHEKSSAASLESMRRFGVDTSQAIGVKIPELRKLARRIKTDHALALQLWDTGIHEARILASMVDDPRQVTLRQIDAWVKGFNSWDLCDQVCGNLLDRTEFAVHCARKYSGRNEEYVKRAGFVLMAEYAVHNKTAPDEVFVSFLPVIEREAADERNFVKKAINWALRQIGKRNEALCDEAIATAKRIREQDHFSARWIARDALRELEEKKRKS